jgi:hypothetical protein
MDAETTELLRQSLARAVRAPGAEAVEAALHELGWREALRTEGTAAVALLFTEQGMANATSGAIDDVLAAALGHDPGPDVAVVLPAFGRHAPPELTSDGRLSIDGLATARLMKAERAILVVADADGRSASSRAEGRCHRAGLVSATQLPGVPVGGIDPALGLIRVEGGLDLSDWSATTPVDWPRAVAAGQVALAYELIGASRAMLGIAVEHSLSRVQFDRPIASFQAVRHHLADSLLAIEAAHAATTMAAQASPTVEPATFAVLAGIAKALAGRGARTVARHCQQVLAGIGFTTEHGFHHHLRRVLALDGLLGDARTLTRELGQSVVRTRCLPAAPAL